MTRQTLKEGQKVLVHSEFENTRYYTVTFGKNGREDKCNCSGVKQYLGQKKNGEPKYRNQNNCFHIQWARKYWKEGKEVL